MSGVEHPQVSVVIGVRDGAQCVEATLSSVLAQEGVRLECVVVDDGSRDRTLAVLERIASRDARVRLLPLPASGLTGALIAGCAQARGHVIARIDAGDRMLDGRLLAQWTYLVEHPDVDVVTTPFRLRGPGGELLVESEPMSRAADLTADYASGNACRLHGIGHFTVAFRRDAYRRAGEYRPQFRLAQDVDLWTRMAERGRIMRIPQALTDAWLALDGLSPRHHTTQQRLRALAAQAARARREHGDEASVLAEADKLSAAAMAAGRGDRARGAYFVASCLELRGQHAQALRYYRIALKSRPLWPKCWLRLPLLALRALSGARLRNGGGEVQW